MAMRIPGSMAGVVPMTILMLCAANVAEAEDKSDTGGAIKVSNTHLERLADHLAFVAEAWGPLAGATLPNRLGGVQVLTLPDSSRTGSAPHSLYYTFPDGGALSYYSEQSESSSSISAFETAGTNLSSLSSYGWLSSLDDAIGSIGFSESYWEGDVQIQKGLTFYDDKFLNWGSGSTLVNEYVFSQSATQTGYDILEWQVRDSLQSAYSGEVQTTVEGLNTLRQFIGSSTEQSPERTIQCDADSDTSYSYANGYYYFSEVEESCDSDQTAGIDWHVVSSTTSSYDALAEVSSYSNSGRIACLGGNGVMVEYFFEYDEEAQVVLYHDAQSGEISELQCAYMPS